MNPCLALDQFGRATEPALEGIIQFVCDSPALSFFLWLSVVGPQPEIDPDDASVLHDRVEQLGRKPLLYTVYLSAVHYTSCAAHSHAQEWRARFGCGKPPYVVLKDPRMCRHPLTPAVSENYGPVILRVLPSRRNAEPQLLQTVMRSQVAAASNLIGCSVV
jgi:hypothetical protein